MQLHAQRAPVRDSVFQYLLRLRIPCKSSIFFEGLYNSRVRCHSLCAKGGKEPPLLEMNFITGAFMVMGS